MYFISLFGFSHFHFRYHHSGPNLEQKNIVAISVFSFGFCIFIEGLWINIAVKIF